MNLRRSASRRAFTLLEVLVALAEEAAGGALLYAWSLAAGVVVHVLALALFFLVFRIRKHGQGLVEVARSLQ